MKLVTTEIQKAMLKHGLIKKMTALITAQANTNSEELIQLQVISILQLKPMDMLSSLSHALPVYIHTDQQSTTLSFSSRYTKVVQDSPISIMSIRRINLFLLPAQTIMPTMFTLSMSNMSGSEAHIEITLLKLIPNSLTLKLQIVMAILTRSIWMDNHLVALLLQAMKE